MHMYAPEYGFMGTNGIVGAPIPLATGGALSAKMRKKGQMVVSFFGDGAVNSGSFHEAVNFGAVWDLPVVYVCENNLYATEMAFSRATKNTSVASRAAAYKIPGVAVDGNDVLEVYAKAGEAVERARRGEGPTLLECLTYRWFGHHEGDPGTSYRTKEEVAAWKKKDPIQRLREKAVAESWATAGEFNDIDNEVSRVIQDAATFAVGNPQPAVSTALDHVFSN